MLGGLPSTLPWPSPLVYFACSPYTPRDDFQGVSDDADIQAIMARIPQLTAAT
jgi:hypothetical protein